MHRFIFSCLSAIAVLCFVQVGLAQAGLVNQWQFEEGSGTTAADSVGGQDGELTNMADPATNWVAAGAPVPSGTTWALDFDGNNDHVRATGYTGITGTDPRSVSAWIKTTDQTAGIISWGRNKAGQKWTFRVQNTNGPPGAIRVEVNGGYQVGTTAVDDDAWHHVVATWEDDGTSPDVNDVRLWVDGRLEGIGADLDEEINTGGNNSSNWKDVRIGMSVSGDAKHLQGQIDEVRIYDHALSRSEILALAGAPADPYYDTVMAHGPIAYYRLGEPSGGKAINEGSLGSAADGEYNGGPTLGETGAVPGNTSVAFDGNDDFVEVTDYKGITGLNPRSVSAWIKTTEDDNEGIVAWGKANDGEKWTFRVQDDNGPIDGNIRVEVGGGRQAGTTVITDGQWHHVVATWEDDGTPNVNDVRLWVDGELEGVGEVSDQSMAVGTGGADPSTGIDVRIGRGLPNSQWFDGGIDEVQIYDRALSRNEIRALAGHAPDSYFAAVQADNPIAYWRLGEAEGNGDKAFNEGSLGSQVDGTYNGNPQQGQPSLVPTITNPSATFDGSGDRVNIPDNDAINDSGPYFQKSIEAWFSVSPDSAGREVIYEQGGQTEGLNLYTRKQSGDFFIRNGAWLIDPDDGTTERTHFPDQVQIDPDTTYHGMSVYNADETSLVLYLNGAPVAGKVAGNIQEIGKHSSDVAIGRKEQGTQFDNGKSSGDGNVFTGGIDEVALYNDALSLRSVQTHYVVGSGDRLGITPGAALGVALNYDAGLDADGDTSWQDSIGSRRNNATANAFDWDLDNAGGDVPRVPLISNTINGNILTHAYVFDGSDNVTTRSFQEVAGDPSRFSASFELVVKPDDLSGQEVIFETGGNTDGLAFWLDDSVLHFDVKDDTVEARPQFDLAGLSAGQQNDFLHVVGVADLDNEEALLYVNGLLRVTQDANGGDLTAWSGTGDAGLGSINGNMAFTARDPFEGQIALLRFYPGVLSAGDVSGNFSALVPEPSTWILLALGGLALAFARRRKR